MLESAGRRLAQRNHQSMVAAPSQSKPGPPPQQHRLEVEPFCHSPLPLALNAFHLSRSLDLRSRTSRPHSTIFLSLAHLQATAARQSQEPAPAKEDTPCCAGRDGDERTEHVYASPRAMHRVRKRALTRSAGTRPRRRKINGNFPTTRISPTISMMRCLARTARTQHIPHS